MDNANRVWSRDPARRRGTLPRVTVNPERLEGWARRRLGLPRDQSAASPCNSGCSRE
jgi:hypothetical protein